MADDDMAMTQASDHGLSKRQVREAEAHRGFVREMDRVLGKAYGTGGALVLGVLLALVVVGWGMGWLTQLTLWVPGITAVLLAMYLVRRWIYARRDRLRQRVEKYCEANEIGSETLRCYYEAEDMYPFFLAIYEQRPRALGDEQRAVEQ